MNSNKTKPPVFALRLMRVFAYYKNEFDIMGDLNELYLQKIKNYGKFRANLWIWRQVVLTMPEYFVSLFTRSMSMFHNYSKIAFRNLKKYKVYSFINISGLAVGISIFILASLFALFEFSFDIFHKNADRIFGVILESPSANRTTRNSAIIPAPLLPELMQDFPEIENGTRYFRASRKIVKRGNESFYENNFLFVDPNFLTFFTFEMIKGEPGAVLNDVNSVVITEEMAEKYFGDSDPIGEVLTYDNKLDLNITGIIKKAPLNSGIRYDFIVSLETARSLYSWFDNWNVNSIAAFVRLQESNDQSQIEIRLPDFLKEHIADSPGGPDRLYLLPIGDFHSRGESLRLSSFMARNMPFDILYWFVGMAILLLVVVCINFMNLSTARYTTRVKEVGMRKVIGAKRPQLIKQFIGESVIMSVIALPLAIIIYEIIRPRFITVMQFDMDITLWHYPGFIIALIGGSILLGFVVGIYPAFFLSKFSSIQVLKNSVQKGQKGARFRKILIVSQFSLSVLFVVYALTVRNQMDFIFNFDFGYNVNQVITVPINQNVSDKVELIKQELIVHPEINYVSSSIYMPIHWKSESQVIPEGFNEESTWTMSVYGIDYDFLEALDINVLMGRGFSKEFADENRLIINEKASSQLGWEDPLGKTIKYQGIEGTVIGVVKDFQFYDLHDEMNPTILYLAPKKIRYVLLKYSPLAETSTIEGFLKTKWNQIVPDIPLEYTTLRSEFENGYSYVKTMASLCGIFGGLTVFISCLGLLGLASFSILRRTKEIGVRKVLGASVPVITKMLLSEFVILLTISSIISIPTTYYFVDSTLRYAWSQNVGVQILPFVIAILMIIVSAVFAVIYQTYKAAYANPVDSLRYE